VTLNLLKEFSASLQATRSPDPLEKFYGAQYLHMCIDREFSLEAGAQRSAVVAHGQRNSH